MAKPDPELEICPHCKKPILDGQAIYTITRVHWECHEKFGFSASKLRDSFDKLRASIRDIEKKLRE